jgi:hypothetical protein
MFTISPYYHWVQAANEEEEEEERLLFPRLRSNVEVDNYDEEENFLRYMLYLKEPRGSTINRLMWMFDRNYETYGEGTWRTLKSTNAANYISDELKESWTAGNRGALPFLRVGTIYGPRLDRYDRWMYQPADPVEDTPAIPFAQVAVDGFSKDYCMQPRELVITPDSKLDLYIQFDGPLLNSCDWQMIINAGIDGVLPFKYTGPEARSHFKVAHPHDCEICLGAKKLVLLEKEGHSMYENQKGALLEALKL